MGFFACKDDNGVVIFYHSTINNTIPSGAIEITDDQFNQAMQVDRQYVDIVNGALVINTPPQPTQAELLQQAQQSKILELMMSRDAEIQEGFTSSVTGHSYRYTKDDQLELVKKMIRVTNDPSITQVDWYCTDVKNLVTHTRDQFLSLQEDAEIHEQTLYDKFYTKKAQVESCTTVDQVNSIVWNDTTPPAVPTGLTATAVTQGANLTWTANTDIDLAGYNVYQSPDGATWTKINTSLVTTNSYSVTGLTSGSTYQFAVTALDTDGNESAKSTPVSVTAD